MSQKNPQYSRNDPSPRFRQLVEQYRSMHRDGDPRRGIPAGQMFDGKSLPRQAYRIKRMIARTGAKTILDYGSGKGTQYLPGKIFENGVPRWNSMQEYWGVEAIRCYDPGYQPFSVLPEGAFDGVVCTDVLEHCPEEDLRWIVGELFGSARCFVFANVACYPAAKTLPNGENAHCTVRPVSFWRAIFESAAGGSSGVLWEVWADTPRETGLGEARVGNFEVIAEPSPAAASRTPLWRMV